MTPIQSLLPRLIIYNGQTLIADRVTVAVTQRDKTKGLLGVTSFEPGEAMLFSHTTAIHTFGMFFPIDVVFLDSKGVVLGIFEGVGSGQQLSIPSASSVLELPAGGAREIALGDRLTFQQG